MLRRRLVPAVPAVVLLFAAACSDSFAPPARTIHSEQRALANNSEGRGDFQRYVAIGTSISMGWASDGVVAASQENSWPAQLARKAGREITQPYIDGTGCRSPLKGPLATGVRLSGEGAGADAATLSCSPLRAGVTEPVSNLAINAALTRDALFTTPENVADQANKQLYSRVLAPGQSQVSSMLALNPKLVSVELGGNEILNARNGIAIEGFSMFPYALWQPLYDQVLDQVQSVAKHVLIVGLLRDISNAAALRRGDELWGQRAVFAGAFNVAVSDDCAGSANLLFVPVVVPTAIATGAFYKKNGLGMYPLHCAGGGPTTEDYTLTPQEVATVNALMARMDAHIREEAQRRGFAYFALDALYGRTDVKPAFDVLALMTSAQPYGPYYSLDGVHPSALGSGVLADAAARAINERYGLGIPLILSN
jgi:lysophospholipase L1-like esterase